MAERDRIAVIRRLIAEGRLVAAEGEAWTWPAPIGWQHAESLAMVARSYQRQGATTDALRVWRAAACLAQAGEYGVDRQDQLDAASVLQEIAEDLLVAGHTQEAQTVAQAMRHAGRRTRALATLAAITAGDVAHPPRYDDPPAAGGQPPAAS